MKTPQGELVDASAIDKTTLTVRSREIKQGPTQIKLSFDGGKAPGTMAMGGQEKPVAADSGRHAVRGRRRRLSVDRRAAVEGGLHDDIPQLRRAEAEGDREGGEGERRPRTSPFPAGTFKAWKVEIKSADGEPGSQTIWVDSTSRRVVKMSATLPEMGGAIATMELQK